MHLYIFVRGIKQDVDYFLRDLEAIYMPHSYEVNGQKFNGFMQMGVRSWGGFYELVFPETALQEVLGTLTCAGRDKFAAYKGWQYPLGLAALRLALGGLKKVPAYDAKTQWKITSKIKYPDIRIIPIGIKKDVVGDYELRDPQTGATKGIGHGESL